MSAMRDEDHLPKMGSAFHYGLARLFPGDLRFLFRGDISGIFRIHFRGDGHGLDSFGGSNMHRLRLGHEAERMADPIR